MLHDLPVDQLLTVDQAIAILDSVAVHPRIVRLPLLEAMGLRLAEDVFADRDFPPFDRAVMDGFAVRSSDVSFAGVKLAVVETVAAGQTGQRAVGPGEAVGIMTGAPLPAGADAVVPIERVSRDGRRIVVHQAVAVGQAVARKGSDAPMGRMLLQKGVTLESAQLGVLAAVGTPSILVFDAPSVAILATGDELVGIDQSPAESQIRNSNSVMMHGLLKRLGCQVRDLGICRDDPAALKLAIEDGLESDALFITGGMSMGERDYVPGLLQEAGLQLLVSKVRIRPGKPFAFARGEDGRMAFGLPGNPVSAFVCTVRLASRVLARLGGGLPKGLVQSILRMDLPKNGPRECYLPARHIEGRVEPLHPSGSADLFTLAFADCLICRRELAPAASDGDSIFILELP